MRVAPKVEEVPLILFFCFDRINIKAIFLTPKFPQKNDGETFWKISSIISPKKIITKFFDEFFILYF